VYGIGSIAKTLATPNKTGSNAMWKIEKPTTIIFDPQTFKNLEHGVIEKGFDGHKKIQVRKRYAVTDSSGRLLTTMEGGVI